jgi:hypothetical protein
MVAQYDGFWAEITGPPLLVWLILCVLVCRFGRNHGLLTLLIFGIGLALMWFYLVFGLAIYSDYVQVNYYRSAEDTTIELSNSSWPCTEVDQCQCAEAPLGAPSCRQAEADLLANGSLLWQEVCGNGYYCCSSVTYCVAYGQHCSQNCGKYSCSTSCYSYCLAYQTQCIQSTSNCQCLAQRGICSQQRAVVSYQNQYNQTVQVTIVADCGLNDTACIERFYAVYGPVGCHHRVYYAPWDFNQITDHVGYNPGQLVNLCLPCVYIVGVLIYGLVILWRTHSWAALCCTYHYGQWHNNPNWPSLSAPPAYSPAPQPAIFELKDRHVVNDNIYA